MGKQTCKSCPVARHAARCCDRTPRLPAGTHGSRYQDQGSTRPKGWLQQPFDARSRSKRCQIRYAASVVSGSLQGLKEINPTLFRKSTRPLF